MREQNSKTMGWINWGIQESSEEEDDCSWKCLDCGGGFPMISTILMGGIELAAFENIPRPELKVFPKKSHMDRYRNLHRIDSYWELMRGVMHVIR